MILTIILYAGSTSKSAPERFTPHKNGHRIKSGRRTFSPIVHKYGSYLRPGLYEHIEPVKTKAEAERLEKELALELRWKCYAVWYN